MTSVVPYSLPASYYLSPWYYCTPGHYRTVLYRFQYARRHRRDGRLRIASRLCRTDFAKSKTQANELKGINIIWHIPL